VNIESSKNSTDKSSKDNINFKRIGRELAMQFLFQTDINENDFSHEQAMSLFWKQIDEAGDFEPDRQLRKGKVYAEELITGVLENLKEVDDQLVTHAKKWNLNRMAVVDRNVMRVAIYEMLYRLDIPPIVSINEAVEISKDFSGDKSAAFINGILNGVKDGLARPERKGIEEE
jgi:N utilization substance protein B